MTSFISNFTNRDFAFFVLFALSVTGQLADWWTTSIALEHGFVEMNPLMRKLLKNHPQLVAPLKCGFVPMMVMPIAIFAGLTAAIVWAGIIAAGGWAYGIRNYLKLKKAGISLK